MRTPTAMPLLGVALLASACATLDYDPGVRQPATFYVTKNTVRPPFGSGVLAMFLEIRGHFAETDREIRLFRPYFGERRLPQKGDVCEVTYKHKAYQYGDYYGDNHPFPQYPVNLVSRIECIPGTA